MKLQQDIDYKFLVLVDWIRKDNICWTLFESNGNVINILKQKPKAISLSHVSTNPNLVELLNNLTINDTLVHTMDNIYWRHIPCNKKCNRINRKYGTYWLE